MKKNKNKFKEDPEFEAYLKRAQNPNHIPGIYNYCDRWCERCSFTNRCLVYEESEERFKDVKDKSIENKEFWNKLAEALEFTKKLIKYISEKQGIDLSNIDNDEYVKKAMKKMKDAEKKAKTHPIAKLAWKYSQDVHSFFEKEKKLLKSKGKELIKNVEMGIEMDKTYYDAHDIKDALDVIGWYAPQIWVKMMRALSGKFEGEEWEDDPEYSGQRDSDGSAKVALIGIDRSIAAWGIMQKHFEKKSDMILDTLLVLDKLRKLIEKEFPNARKFIRAGFDEPHLYPEACLM